ncbi:sodium:solute symporter family protein [candidate division KSB1 bacterium]|nr:sodium:solute symporter family protein [candidate division KSB1 bacterium]
MIPIYWLGFILYAVFVVYLGWRSYRSKQPASEVDVDFWAAGKSLGPWATGLSISASFMSISWSCVYAVQLVYWYGLSALWLLAIPWLIVMVFYYILTPHFRKLPAFSQPEMVAQRFGQNTRAYLALPLAFVFLVWGGAEIFAAAKILSPILDISFHLILAFIAVVVALYSFLGGFAAVVTTDKLQFALVAFFVLSISWVSGKAVLAQVSLLEVFNTLPSPPKSGSSALSMFAVGPALIALTLLAYLPGWVVETDIWLRLQASKTNTTARKGVTIAAFNSVVFMAGLPVLIGLAALYLYPPNGAEIPSELNDGDAIFALLIRDHSPALLTALLIVGLSAAAMSTIDTCSNVMALSLSYDIIEPYLAKRKKTVDLRIVARVMSAGAVMLAYIFALFTESLWDIFYLSSGILTTTIFIPMIALFRKNATKVQVQSAATAGFISTFIFYFLEKNGILQPFQPEWLSDTGLGYIMWGFLASFVAYSATKKIRQSATR